MTPEQSQLLNMSMWVVGSSLAGCILAAWFFRNIINWAIIIIGFIASIALMFVAFAIAQTNNGFLVLLASFLFGATSGCTLGGFILAVTENHSRAKEVVAITVGIVAIATVATAVVGIFSGYNFQGLGTYLFTGLLILIGIVIFQIFFQVSKKTDLVIGAMASVFWVVYLLYDFNKVVDKYDQATWEAALDIGMNVYLNMVNLFVRLLPIIADALD
jgi:FtsH-binding integral membrane protein